ncbi:MAG: acetyl/propionyl/methylcrotonyl-CoA carboxylase subunit alpha [Thermodesulfobacteriota bacterium]
MFKKILIANRGEIACRVIKSAKRMRIRTVAVYSEADRDALHVQMADEAVCIGPPPAAASYLNAARIIEVCGETGAEAVHPGYGFLSENTYFARKLAAAGIAFIGPPPEAISAMGDKLESKRIAARAGVSTIPGHDTIIADAEEAVRVANRIGYPVMLKASAGGGGKGMRVAASDAECRDGFERATNEAKTAFGDNRILIEKFIEEPRHIEMQIIADNFGNTFWLGERECSIQRRHQKVLEESPSPFLDAVTRRRMGEEAVALARAVGYRSAGTVEFVVDRDRNFYFLEMNTRLQVEHPVTEYVTGLDLVELMIRVAANQDLRLVQGEIPMQGWALEARIYAEDPFRKFLPSTGRLIAYRPPAENEHVRVDTGVYEGGEVSIHYDPMIAKLIAHGSTRGEAINRLQEALDAFYIRGVAHNIGFLQALLAHPRFQDGQFTTNFIAAEYPDGFHPADAPRKNPELFVVAAATVHRIYMERAAKLSGQMFGREKRVEKSWVVVMDREHHPVTVSAENHGHGYTVEHAGRSWTVLPDWQLGAPLFRAAVNRVPLCMQVERHGLRYRISHGGCQADVLVLSPRAAELNAHMKEKPPADTSRFLLSPMPGLLLKLPVREGDEVKAGEELAVVEAMKMENSLKAERDAVVARLLANPGDSLAVDQPIIEFG